MPQTVDAAVPGPVESEHLMVNSLYIENFRCFQKLELHGLRQVNVIVGDNGAGKTSLLEAIYSAASGNPDVLFKLRAWRGMGPTLNILLDRRAFEEIWRDIFFSFDDTRMVSISLQGTPETTRSVQVYYDAQESLTLPLGEQKADSIVIRPLSFKWIDSEGKERIAQAKISSSGLSFENSNEPMRSAFYPFSMLVNQNEPAFQFSELSKRNKEGSVVKALQKQFPDIENVSVELNAGSTLLYARVPFFKEKVPLGLISGGAQRMLAIWLGIATFARGVVLVDEIEDGIYHVRQAEMWRTLLDFSSQHRTQIFATTHSLECLKAILPVAQGNEDAFCLIRMEKSTGGEAQARMFSGRQMVAALKKDGEIRDA